MKKFAKLSSLILAAILLSFAGCNDNENDFGYIKDVNKKDLEQTLYADETDADIYFRATDDWVAYISTTSTSEAVTLDWIRLDQYSGGPGKYTLSIMLDENTTRNARTAYVNISTGNSRVYAVIMQKGEKEDGTIPVE